MRVASVSRLKARALNSELFMKKVIAKLDSIHQRMLDLVTPFDEQKFSERISSDRWSVAENIHHLYLVETKYVKLLNKALQSQDKGMNPFRRLFQVPPQLVGIRLVRVKVPEKAVEPVNAPKKETVLENYNKVRAELKALAKEHGKARLKNVALPHPMFGLFDGVNVVRFLAYHEQRHYKQILETVR
jgi:hypothetical protein